MGLIQLAQHNIASALDHLRRSVQSDPTNAEFHNNLGVILRSEQKLDEAQSHFKRAAELDPQNATALYNCGTSLQFRDDLAGAEKFFRQAIAVDNEYADPCCQLGDILARQNNLKEGLSWWRKAIELDPNHASAHLFIGYALSSSGHPQDAATMLSRAAQLMPDDSRPHWLLGNVLQRHQRYDAAIESFQRAAALDPKCAPAYRGLCQSLAMRNRVPEALEAGRYAIQLDPDSVDAYNAMAIAFERSGRKNEAAVCYRTAARLDPGAEKWKYSAAAFSEAKDTPPAAPRDYLLGLFGEYAASFDQHLVHELKYRAPEHLLAAVRSLSPNDHMDILDLGCGTGLAGELFKPFARWLVGVDLVPQMIEQSRQRNIYDELHQEELHTFLRAAEKTFDLILAADVFIYIGDLSNIFPHVCRILRAGGLFAFSIERQDDPGYRLRVSRRYTHNIEYIRDLARAHALTETFVQEHSLRQEDGKDVAGWIIVLRKSDSTPGGGFSVS